MEINTAQQADRICFTGRHPFCTDAYRLGYTVGYRENTSGFQADDYANVDLPLDFLDNNFHDPDLGRFLDRVDRYQPDVAVTRFAGANAEALSARPSAFFLLSLTAADDADESRAAVADLGAAMERETGWRPDEVAAFAGALKYSEYGPLTRVVMKRVARRYGGDTDTSRDYEYTDWDEVAAFAARVAERLDGAA